MSAGILLGGVIIFVLWWDRSKKNAAPDETHGEESFSHGASTQDMKLRGLAGVHASPPPPIDSLRRPSSGITAYDLGYTHSAAGKGGYDHDAKQSLDVAFPPPMGSNNYIQENSFLSLSSDLAKVDPLRPQTASPSTPPQSAPQSPRSASAQPITHPYSVGAHPFVSPTISHAPLYRPSFERTATSTTAIAQDPSARVGPDIAGFAGAGARPGYDPYGFEPRTVGAISPNHNGAIVHRPSIESIRNLARKASQPNIPSEPTYPPTGGYSRTRNNSTSTYAGSVRAGKVKPTKEEKAKEMAAMDNLIAALDESAEAERRRKERLVAAAGIMDNQQSSSKKGAGTGRRKDAAITGSYPLPPPEVFRAALSRGAADPDDEPDDNEIERWRRN